MRTRELRVLFVCMIMLSVSCAGIKPSYEREDVVTTSGPPREFRGLWVATVANIDWPTEPGLPSDDQKREAITILETAERCNLNAIVLQVRPQCDAYYPSDIEPWSYFLTGEQGKAPEPFYDPLAFWIEEAHNRGMELHVWFNPYRAHHPGGGPVRETSVVKRHPDIVKELSGGYYWLDPAKEATKEYSLSVLMDVLRRYDIDGVHFDDYFYPYPSYNDNRDFPDDDTWAESGREGKMNRHDWRRKHVNDFIQRLSKAIKAEKPWVKFGISPFGIWRPYNPPSIRGFDQYDVLFADAKLWLEKGWIDYFTPQLYWPISQVPQSYPVLLGWWTRQNDKNRNLWPGLYTSRVSDEKWVSEIVNQVMVTRGFVPDDPGNIHFSAKALVANTNGIADALAEGPYSSGAIVPQSSWMGDDSPSAPSVTITRGEKAVTCKWTPGKGKAPFRWVVYAKRGDQWYYELYNRTDTSADIPLTIVTGWNDNGEAETLPPLTGLAVSAVSRGGTESTRTVVTLDSVSAQSR